MDTPRFQKKIAEIAADEKYLATAQAFIELLADEKLPLYKEKAKEVKALAATLGGVSVNGAEPAPAVLVAAIDDLRTESAKFLDGLNALRVLLIARTPEIKEEDNAGVAIQMAFADVIDSYSDALTGLSGGKKDGGSGIALVPLALKKEYFSARATAEEKVHKTTCSCGTACKCGVDGKDCGCNISKETVSSPAVLAQIDADTAFKVSVGFTKLHQAALQIVIGVTRNVSKMLTPRRSGSSMIG